MCLSASPSRGGVRKRIRCSAKLQHCDTATVGVRSAWWETGSSLRAGVGSLGMYATTYRTMYDTALRPTISDAWTASCLNPYVLFLLACPRTNTPNHWPKRRLLPPAAHRPKLLPPPPPPHARTKLTNERMPCDQPVEYGTAPSNKQTQLPKCSTAAVTASTTSM